MNAKLSLVLVAPFLLLLTACSGADEPRPPATATLPVADTPQPAGPEETASPAASPTVEAPARRLTETDFAMQAYAVPAGSRPHDVAPAVDGGVWYTAQGSGKLGWLDPETGAVREIELGAGSRPHGVIVGPGGAPWVTDSGLNAIVRVDPETDELTIYELPADRGNVNLNTAAFDLTRDMLWFTGQSGVFGRVVLRTGEVLVYDSPNGPGPYGITSTPDGDIFYASLAGSYVGNIDPGATSVHIVGPPTPDQGARRVWSDSLGRIWVSEWNSGQVSVYDPEGDSWQTWGLPGDNPRAYAVYVDELDAVWLSNFGGNAIHRFDPETETFLTFELPHAGGNVRQILGREGEIWAPESAVDQIVVIRF